MEGNNNPFVKRKIFPAIDIDQTITKFDNYRLQGIIWHHGEGLDTGQYTSLVNPLTPGGSSSDQSSRDYCIACMYVPMNVFGDPGFYYPNL